MRISQGSLDCPGECCLMPQDHPPHQWARHPHTRHRPLDFARRSAPSCAESAKWALPPVVSFQHARIAIRRRIARDFPLPMSDHARYPYYLWISLASARLDAAPSRVAGLGRPGPCPWTGALVESLGCDVRALRHKDTCRRGSQLRCCRTCSSTLLLFEDRRSTGAQRPSPDSRRHTRNG